MAPHPATGLACLSALASLAALASGAEVRVQQQPGGTFTLLRDGQPHPIRGVCGSAHLASLREHGGNSIRTYGIEDLDRSVDGKPLLDRCAELGISVSAGLWAAHERHGFDYSKPDQLQRQRTAILNAVRKHRSHPALLLWSLGNEMEGPPDNPRAPLIFQELNTLAALIKAEDPHHPVMTVLAGSAPEKIRALLAHYPNLDILGINAYAGASSAATAAAAAGWKKPVVLAEYGPPGHWEVPKTIWGAPLEPSSREKAASCYSTYKTLLEDSPATALGSYCFLWGQKQETTSTWYGMFLRTGEKLPQVDALCRAWTDRWPTNRCPRVERLESELREATLPPGRLCTVHVAASDPDGDPLTFSWTITAESTDLKSGGDAESEPPPLPGLVVHAENSQAVIRTPDQPGNYRLFIVLRDGKGAASAENLCFKVAPR